jgi:WD40 repeat protein
MLLASGDEHGAVLIWDVRTGGGRTLDRRHDSAVRRLDFSPDGRLLASSTHEVPAETLLWEIPGGGCRGQVVGLKGFIGRHVFSSDHDGLIGIEHEPGAPLPRLIYASLTKTSESSRYLAEAATQPILERLGLRDDRLQLLADVLARNTDAPNFDATEVNRFILGSRPRGVALSGTNQFVVIGDGDGTFEASLAWQGAPRVVGRIHEQGALIVLENRDRVSAPRSAEEQKRLDRFVELFPPQTTTRDREPNRAREIIPVETVAAASGAHRLARFRRAPERLSVIDTRTGEEVSTYAYGPLPEAEWFVFSRDGQSLAIAGGDHPIRLWRIDPPGGSVTLPGHAPKEAWSVAFAPDGSSLASAGDDGAIRLWDSRSGLAGRVLAGHDLLVTSIAYASVGKLLASGSFDKTVKLWDPATGDCRATFAGHDNNVRAVAFSPDSRMVASASDDRTVRLWDVAAVGPKRDPLIGHTDKVFTLAFQPGGRILASGSLDETIRLWDVKTGEVRIIEAGEQVYSLAFSPDGRQLASSHQHGPVKVWDVNAGTLIFTLLGHSGNAFGVTFSPDGRSLVSCGADRMVRVWDPVTGQELLCLTGHADRVNAVAFSRDGHMLASADHTGAIRLWCDHPAP